MEQKEKLSSKQMLNDLMANHYKSAMEAKENGEATRMFTVGTDKIVKGFVMLSKSGEDISFISIDGEIEREKLEAAKAGIPVSEEQEKRVESFKAYVVKTEDEAAYTLRQQDKAVNC